MMTKASEAPKKLFWTAAGFVLLVNSGQIIRTVRDSSYLSGAPGPIFGGVVVVDHGSESSIVVGRNRTRDRFRCQLPDNSTFNKPVFPDLIIVGAQKAGTSALRNILLQVPYIKGSIYGEPHFWDDPRMRESGSLSRDKQCQILREYYKEFRSEDVKDPDVILFEKTPSLLAFEQLPHTLRTVMDPFPPKIVILLRDPIARYYSAFKMDYDRARLWNEPLESFDEIVEWEVKKLKKVGFLQVPDFSPNKRIWNASDFSRHGNVTINYRMKRDFGLARGFYASQVVEYMKYFRLGESLKVVEYEYFSSNKEEVLNELLVFLGREPYNWTEVELDADMGPFSQRSPAREKLLGGSSRTYPPLRNETLAYLKLLYRPFNEELADILGDEWRGVWD